MKRVRLVTAFGIILTGSIIWFVDRRPERRLEPAAVLQTPTGITPSEASSTKVIPAANRPARRSKAHSDDLDEFAREMSSGTDTFFDPEYRIVGKIPPGWNLKRSAHWGTNQGTVWLEDPNEPGITPNLYYKLYDTPLALSSKDDINAWLLDQAAQKAQQRVQEGWSDYVNGPMNLITIDDRPALEWTATYTVNGQPFSEYLIRLYSPNGTALYFTQGPADQMQDVIPTVRVIAGKTVMP